MSKTSGLLCPWCRQAGSTVTHTLPVKVGDNTEAIKRHRKCSSCGWSYATVEQVIQDTDKPQNPPGRLSA